MSSMGRGFVSSDGSMWMAGGAWSLRVRGMPSVDSALWEKKASVEVSPRVMDGRYIWGRRGSGQCFSGHHRK